MPKIFAGLDVMVDAQNTDKMEFAIFDLSTIKGMMIVAVFGCVIVLFAMLLDLISGLRKAKLRGEVHTSWGLKRSLTKFITYEGGMMIAFGIDLFIHFSKLLELFNLHAIIGVPVVTCLIGIFLLVVEFMSIREKADKKTKKDFSDAGELLTKMIESKAFKEAMLLAIKTNKQNENGGTDVAEETEE